MNIRPVFYLKINTNSDFALKCFWHWVEIVEAYGADFYVVCDKEELKPIFCGGATSEFKFIPSSNEARDLLSGLILQPCLNVGTALLTPFIHAKENGFASFYNIDADDTFLLCEAQSCAKALLSAAEYADENNMNCLSIDIHSSVSNCTHWSFGVTYTKMDIDYIEVLEKSKGLMEEFTQTQNNLIFLSQNAKHEISRKMCAHTAEETVIEVNLADHCNLNCRSCDHFSPIAEPSFLSLATFERDVARIAELSNARLGRLNCLGGEPLLNRETPEFLRIARHHLPNTELWLFTNGLLLLDPHIDEVWRTCRENDVTIQLTKYPIKLDFFAIEEKAHSEKVKLEVFQTHTDFIKYTLNPHGGRPLFPVIECAQMNWCTVLRNGRIYMCPLSAHIDKFNAKHGQMFNVQENDSIDIYTAQSFEEIAEFTSRPVPFCRYCDIGKRERNNWRTSERTTDEYLTHI